jgi:hypothetical protein
MNARPRGDLLRARMAESGRRVAQQYSWTRVLPRDLDLYRSLV